MTNYHEPVMAAESIDGLAIKEDGIYVDATFGGGGHSALILNKLGDKGRLFGFDQDEDAAANVPDDDRLVFVPHNFRFLHRFLKLHGVKQVDGILADLGVSSHQINVAERGFSYRFDSQLDMRMNRQGELTAEKVINTYSEEELQRVFSDYGEVRNARTLAARIVSERSTGNISTVGALLAVVEPLIRGKKERYLSQVFQALRIEVNDEMGALEAFLQQSLEALRAGGRLVVIAYHSVEDRMVKNFMKTGNAAGVAERDFYGNIYRPFHLVTKKALLPSAAETRANPRARSAKLRIAERLESELEGKELSPEE